MTKSIWLMKSEPSVYSIQDLERDGNMGWEGVRNYQARNFMRDKMRCGDPVLFYHSNTEQTGIAGFAEISKEAYPDAFAWDKKSRYYDPKSSPDNPVWYRVDICFKRRLKQVLTLEQLRKCRGLKDMLVLKRGQRLSIQPVTLSEWKEIQKLVKSLEAMP